MTVSSSQPVPSADLEVDRVVPGRHLERAGAELRVDVLVCNHGNVPLDEGDDHLLADERPVPLVVGMNRDRDVGEDRRRPDGGNRDLPGTVDERVADIRERVVDVLVLDLEIR